MSYTQENRILELQTPLGEDKLLLRALRGREGISQLFHFDLDLLSESDNSIKFESILGHPVVIAIRPQNAEARYIHGFVSNFAQSGNLGLFSRYHMEVVPWLWFLGQTTDCRIFQRMTVPEIIEKIFRDLGFTDYKLDLHGIYEPREYCVQYRESDLNFVSRLMEEYGIFYFFMHDEEKHTLMLSDSSAVHKPVPQQSHVRFAVRTVVAESEDEGIITSWNIRQEVRPGAYATRDYNFKVPRLNLSAHVPSKVKLERAKNLEIYDYPGEYTKVAEGEHLAKIRIEQEETFSVVAHGTGDCRTFLPGYWFALTEHERADLNGKYLLTEVHHTGSSEGSYRTGTGGSGDNHYSNSFTCIPLETLFRPPRVTPQPIVQGPQTAMVVGLQGEEIHTDKYGRVKVQFHWDREGRHNEQSSCWIRVSQPWAGKGWGAISIPRIGQEVVVDFLEGDPDRPIITGRVYNADQMPPYSLPEGAANMGFKSKSVHGGGYNEVSINDTNATEGITIHAQHNMSTVVEHDETVHIKNNRTETVDVDEKITIGNNRTEKVAVDESVEIGSNQDLKVGANRKKDVAGNETITIVGNRNCMVGKNEILSVGLTRTQSTGINEMINVGGAQETTVGGVRLVTVGISQYVNVGIKHYLHAGSSLVLDSKGTMSLTAADSITLTCGASTIVLAPGCITIQSPQVKINS